MLQQIPPSNSNMNPSSPIAASPAMKSRRRTRTKTTTAAAAVMLAVASIVPCHQALVARPPTGISPSCRTPPNPLQRPPSFAAASSSHSRRGYRLSVSAMTDQTDVTTASSTVDDDPALGTNDDGGIDMDAMVMLDDDLPTGRREPPALRMSQTFQKQKQKQKYEQEFSTDPATVAGRRIRANVRETGFDSMKYYMKSMGNHDLLQKKRGDRPGARNPDPHAVGGGPRRARDGTPPPPHLPGVGHQNQGGHDGDADQEADSQEPARQGGAHGEQPPTGHQHRQAVSGAGAQHAGPVSGGHLGPHPRVRKVRSREGVPVLHLRHVVDQAGDHARHRRSGADHPPPRAHSRPAGDCSKDGAGPPE
mmetsp:Transcript_8269/g.17955  ORF Transcript_8269/g.17955 Transcript_8269/m.17955 type:complete len:363 (-) Transcript_8269:672-1760(-)